MADETRHFYDTLAANYHLLFQDWDTAISRQAAVLRKILQNENVVGRSARVLDCACGIGTQALGLAGSGFRVVASDLSPAAVARTSAEAAKRGLNIETFVADLLDLAVIPHSDFDAIVCMDNVLPHFPDDAALLKAVQQIRGKLRSGGRFVASIRDYDELVEKRPAVQGPAFYSDPTGRRIVHQVWDWLDDRRYVFHVYITRETDGTWETHHYTSRYRAVLRGELAQIIKAAGFHWYHWVYPDESGFYQPILLAE